MGHSHLSRQESCHCPLPFASYPLPITHFPLPISHCQLPIIHFQWRYHGTLAFVQAGVISLPIARLQLPFTQFPIHFTNCLLSISWDNHTIPGRSHLIAHYSLNITHCPFLIALDVCLLFFYCKKRIENFDLLNHRTVLSSSRPYQALWPIGNCPFPIGLS